MKRILALDLSLNHCGVARLSGVVAGQPVIETECVAVPKPRVPGKRPGTEKDGPALAGVERLIWWREWLAREVRLGDWEMAVMELPAYRGTGAVLDFGRQFGVVETLLADLGVPVATVGITVLKKYATGIGTADKLRMVETARAVWGEQIRGEDESDAAWLCRVAWDAWGQGEPDNPYREGVCATLRGQFPDVCAWEQGEAK